MHTAADAAAMLVTGAAAGTAAADDATGFAAALAPLAPPIAELAILLVEVEAATAAAAAVAILLVEVEAANGERGGAVGVPIKSCGRAATGAPGEAAGATPTPPNGLLLLLPVQGMLPAMPPVMLTLLVKVFRAGSAGVRIGAEATAAKSSSIENGTGKSAGAGAKEIGLSRITSLTRSAMMP